MTMWDNYHWLNALPWKHDSYKKVMSNYDNCTVRNMVKEFGSQIGMCLGTKAHK